MARINTDRVLWHIMRYMGQGLPFRTADIVDGIEGANYTNILNSLEVLMAERVITRVRRGHYIWNGATERPNKVFYALSRALELDDNYVFVGINSLELVALIRRFLAECGSSDTSALIRRIDDALKGSQGVKEEL